MQVLTKLSYILVCLSIESVFFCSNFVQTEFVNDKKRISSLEESEHGCLEKFNINENTIIRTDDSRRHGANFLNFSDVGNREDCIARCCMTRYCDVAVFEEKVNYLVFLNM